MRKKEEKKLKEIEEELSGRKKMSRNFQNIHLNNSTNNCTCRTSRGHAYLGDGGVLAGLDGPAGVSPTSSSPPGTIVTAPEEKIPPFHRIGVPPVAVTNGGLYATRHQLHNCSILKREDDRSSQATNVRGADESETTNDRLIPIMDNRTGYETTEQMGNLN